MQRLAILRDRPFNGIDMCRATTCYQRSLTAGNVQTAGLLASLPACIPLAAVVADLRKPESHAEAG